MPRRGPAPAAPARGLPRSPPAPNAAPPPSAAVPQTAFCEHINHSLKDDAFLSEGPFKHLPMRPDSDDLFRAVSDGILLRFVQGARRAGMTRVRALRKSSTHIPFASLALSLLAAS